MGTPWVGSLSLLGLMGPLGLIGPLGLMGPQGLMGPGPWVELSCSAPPTSPRAGACREGKGRVPLPLVAVDRRHREWLGRHRGEEPEFYTP